MADYVVKVVSQISVYIRSGPGVSFNRTGQVHFGETFEVDDVRNYDNGDIWYKWKGSNNWSCAFRPSVDNYRYINIIEDRGSKPPTQVPPNTTPPSTEKRDQSYLNEIINSNEGNKGKLAPYDIDYDYAFGNNNSIQMVDVTYDSLARSVISTANATDDPEFARSMKNLKKNLNLNYFDSPDEITETLFSQYNRGKVDFIDTHLSKTFPHVFFTRPDLNFDDNNSILKPEFQNDPVYREIWNSNPACILSLTKNYNASHDLNMLLSNYVKSMEVQDEVIKTEEVGENFVGYKMIYGMNNHDSLTAGTFSVTFSDDKNLTVYRMLKAWVNYISDVFKGVHSPKKEYIDKRIIDYASSCYYILCAEDGNSILYGHKYYGIFPTNIPSSVFSWNEGSVVNNPSYTVQFAYSFREPISLMNLAELNINTISRDKTMETGKFDIPQAASIYNKKLGRTGNTMVGVPFVVEDRNTRSDRIKYRLHFKPE